MTTKTETAVPVLKNLDDLRNVKNASWEDRTREKATKVLVDNTARLVAKRLGGKLVPQNDPEYGFNTYREIGVDGVKFLIRADAHDYKWYVSIFRPELHGKAESEWRNSETEAGIGGKKDADTIAHDIKRRLLDTGKRLYKIAEECFVEWEDYHNRKWSEASRVSEALTGKSLVSDEPRIGRDLSANASLHWHPEKSGYGHIEIHSPDSCSVRLDSIPINLGVKIAKLMHNYANGK